MSSHMDHSTHNSLYKLLDETTVGELIQHQTPIQFKSDDLLKDVFKTLADNEVLSAPVYDPHKKIFTGMIDLRDFVAFMIAVHLKGEASIFTAEKLVDFSGFNPLIPINEDMTVLELLREINIKQTHRFPVISSHDRTKVLGILSQSLIIHWLFKNQDKLGPYVQKSVREFNHAGLAGLSQVLSIRDQDTVLAAFSTIEKYNIHGLAVVNKDGMLIGNISVSDLKFLVDNHLESLRIPIHEFFERYTGKRASLQYCKTDASFISVLEQMATQNVHRVHVLDDDNRPIDIVTPSNVLDIILTIATGGRRR